MLDTIAEISDARAMSYNGGKGGAGVYQTIINQLPPHRVLIIPFAGHGGIGRRIRPPEKIYALDKSLAALALWRTPLATPGDEDLTARYADATRCICACGIAFLEHYPWRGDELVYADPPYLLATRSASRRYYQHELWDTATPGDRQERDTAAHSRLLDVLTSLPCKVALSGYASDLYASKLVHWRHVTFTASTRQGTALECLWMNYPAPTALHDYRFLGNDYRERERIKRKGQRWEAKYRRLPPLERLSILSRLLGTDTA